MIWTSGGLCWSVTKWCGKLGTKPRRLAYPAGPPRCTRSSNRRLAIESFGISNVQRNWTSRKWQFVSGVSNIEALQASLKQQQDHWESEHQQQSRRLAAEQEQLAAERCEIAKERIALQQSARKLQAERQHQVETITRIRSELVKMKSRLATMQQERERWLVQRIRTQRALSVREQNAVAAEQQLAHRDAQLSAWEAQLRRQQQELTEQRRRDLEVAPASAPPGHPALDAVCECTRWHVGINGRLKSPENCLSAPNFFELLDRALREKDRSG